ncbi:MAG: PIG-L deacetylase family protein [Dehalococcoidales bacterium]|jgi:LmbE family N-acetylglucosaminyl deacetylase|nr:PIG-L deacetylase family protein [Dehalococcoidales bacterium]MDP7416145.1 PIG-L deacetylase family protein [Dehalococcoidales bacterium]
MAVKKAHVLVVTPHPDDAEFGVAGTVVHWVKEGKRVIYVVCTNGDKGTSDVNMKSERLAKIREQEQLAAANLLGVAEVVFLRHADQELEDTPEFRKEIVRLIRKYRPEIMVTADPYRRYIGHRDHRITGQVVLDAVFPYARDHLAYPDMLAEGLPPHKVKEIWLWTMLENINHRSDITDTFNIKVAALRCHKSQVGDNRFPDLEERLRQWAKGRAEGEDYELAEAFQRVEIA